MGLSKNKLKVDTCDILLISPEQLANRDRFNELMSYIGKGIGLLLWMKHIVFLIGGMILDRTIAELQM